MYARVLPLSAPEREVTLSTQRSEVAAWPGNAPSWSIC